MYLRNIIGNLRRIAKLRPWSLRSVLMQKYDYPPEQADKLRDFLGPMLALDPQDRPSAGELAKHPWLDDPNAAPPYTKDYAAPSVVPGSSLGMSGLSGIGDGNVLGGGTSAPVDDERLNQVLQVLKAVELAESGQASHGHSTSTRTLGQSTAISAAS